jgi:hypothetical protein
MGYKEVGMGARIELSICITRKVLGITNHQIRNFFDVNPPYPISHFLFPSL